MPVRYKVNQTFQSSRSMTLDSDALSIELEDERGRMMIWHDNPGQLTTFLNQHCSAPAFPPEDDRLPRLGLDAISSAGGPPWRLSTLPVTLLGDFLGRRCGWLNGGSMICYHKQAPLAAHARNKPQHPCSNTSGGREALVSREWRGLATWYA
jgi:hypothetical protein